MKKVLFTLAVMFIAMITLASCSNDEPVLKQSELLSEKTFGNGGDRLSFEYDANGKLTGYIFTPNGGSVFKAILTEKDGIIYQNERPFLYIKDGLATKMTYWTQGVLGVSEYSYEFGYNKGYLMGITMMVTSPSSSDLPTTREYTLEYDQNHNLTSVKQGVHEWKYTYGSLKNRNYYFLDNFPVFFDVAWQMGMLGKCTRNLPESMEMSIDACTYNFEYTIDEEGYVTNVKETEGNLPPASYVYKPFNK